MTAGGADPLPPEAALGVLAIFLIAGLLFQVTPAFTVVFLAFVVALGLHLEMGSGWI